MFAPILPPRFLVAFAFILLLLCWGFVAYFKPPLEPLRPVPQAMERETIGVEHADGSTSTFLVERAITPEQHSAGLMFRKALSAQEGMLFVFNPPERVAFWMKNTHIPLDMLFFDQENRLIYLKERAMPGDLTPVGPEKALVASVLELAGGVAEAQEIKIGDQLISHSGKREE